MRTENLHKKMNGFEICEFVVVGINANTEEQAGISPVYNLVIAELRGRQDTWLISEIEAPLTSTKLDWYFWSRGATSLCTSPRRRTCASTVRNGES